jgi:hypothetical protein
MVALTLVCSVDCRVFRKRRSGPRAAARGYAQRFFTLTAGECGRDSLLSGPLGTKRQALRCMRGLDGSHAGVTRIRPGAHSGYLGPGPHGLCPAAKARAHSARGLGRCARRPVTQLASLMAQTPAVLQGHWQHCDSDSTLESLPVGRPGLQVTLWEMSMRDSGRGPNGSAVALQGPRPPTSQGLQVARRPRGLGACRVP